MKVEILATNPRLAEWDKSFRGKNIVTLQKILHSSFGEETYLHPSAVFLYANDEFSLFHFTINLSIQLSHKFNSFIHFYLIKKHLSYNILYLLSCYFKIIYLFLYFFF